MSTLTELAGTLADVDPAIAAAIAREEQRQRSTLELIASENFASAAVIEAVGTVLTNKYAEGYPGRRYYGGCEFVDEIETLAIERARSLFGAEHANVQPHSGAQANMAVYFGLLKPGDTVMGLRLDQGGHLTHGSNVNFSGKLFEFVSYGVDRETEYIDYDEMAALAREHRPKIIVTGATAYPREIDFARARAIADEVDAILMADMAHIAGLVAAGVHVSPIGQAQIVTSSTHKTLRGPRGGMVLCDEKYARRIDRGVFPNAQGGPLMHVVAAKAVAFAEAATSQFRAYSQQTVDNARVLGETLVDAGLRVVSGGTDNHLLLVDVTPKGTDRPDGGGRAGACGHRRQQERDPLRRTAADRRLRHPRRHARADLARARDGGAAPGRRTDRAHPRCPRGRRRQRGGAHRGSGPVRGVPRAGRPVRIARRRRWGSADRRSAA